MDLPGKNSSWLSRTDINEVVLKILRIFLKTSIATVWSVGDVKNPGSMMGNVDALFEARVTDPRDCGATFIVGQISITFELLRWRHDAQELPATNNRTC
jgi:hypothetical protein